MRAAWYEQQGAARDVLTVGEMDEPQPLAGEVRIRVAASGINSGDVKERQNAFGVGCATRVSPRTATARASWMPSAKVYHTSGPGSACGVTRRRLTALSAPLNTRLSPWSRRFRSPRVCRRSSAPASASPASPPTELFTWRVRLRGAPC
jgi:hypothetical protein